MLAQDDALLGLGSTALTLGDGARAKAVLAGFSTVTIGGLLAAGNMAGVGTIYYPMILLGAGHLAWRASTPTMDATAKATHYPHSCSSSIFISSCSHRARFLSVGKARAANEVAIWPRYRLPNAWAHSLHLHSRRDAHVSCSLAKCFLSVYRSRG